jgi:hypothetical protein
MCDFTIDQKTKQVRARRPSRDSSPALAPDASAAVSNPNTGNRRRRNKSSMAERLA